MLPLQMHEVVAVHQRLHQPIDRGQRIAEGVGYLAGRGTGALRNDLEDSESFLDRGHAGLAGATGGSTGLGQLIGRIGSGSHLFILS